MFFRGPHRAPLLRVMGWSSEGIRAKDLGFTPSSRFTYCLLVPYELAFTKSFEVSCDDPEARGPHAFYINDCCWGGDVVSNLLLPLVKADYERIQAGQEDWGWMIWFRKGDQRFQINIHCDVPKEGEFRIHLVAFRRKWLRRRVADTPELEALRKAVVEKLHEWVSKVKVTPMGPDFMQQEELATEE